MNECIITNNVHGVFMRLLITVNDIAPLLKLLLRSAPEHNTTEKKFNMSKSGPWGTSAGTKAPFKNEEPTTRG